MSETLFIQTHQHTWQELEDILKKLPKRAKHISEDDRLHHLLYLYQTVCGHLSVARTRYGNTGTVEYLNGLVSRAHQTIYVSRPNSLSRIIHFFLNGFPLTVKKESRLLYLSTGIFVLGFLFSFFLTIHREDYALAFISQEMIEAIKHNLSGDAGLSWNHSIASVAIFTNNIQVGILAFALGITFGIGTVYVLVHNGLLLGAFAGIATRVGFGYVFWSLILPHGVPELLCIFICGAAGLLIARSMIFPRLSSRRKSFAAGGKQALLLLLGTLPLFVLAGLTEGYFTPLPINPLWKYLVSVLWLLLLILYFFLKRKERDVSMI